MPQNELANWGVQKWHFSNAGSMMQNIPKKMSDSDIRDAVTQLIAFKESAGQVHELPVCNGKAIADIVELTDEAHCFEIKSDLDSVRRALRQATFYDMAFEKISIITTKAKLVEAKAILPSYWGIKVALQRGSGMTIYTARKANRSPHFLIREHLNLLWKIELQELAEAAKIKIRASFTKEQIIDLIAGSKSKRRILQESANKLRSRVQRRDT